LKDFLKARLGEKLGITRIGIPKEVYFEAKLRAVEGEVAVFEDEKGQLFAIGIDKIIMIGPPERGLEEERQKPGFAPKKDFGK
jgi:hypothetical protein